MIHAADISSVSKKPKLAITLSAENVTVELQYPSASQRERFVWANILQLILKLTDEDMI